jgi:hypothetical protein
VSALAKLADPRPAKPGTPVRDPEHVLTPPQVARMVGWSRRRMYRLLIKANERMGGRLLIDASFGDKRPRWTVSVAALKKLAANWFEDNDRLQLELELLQSKTEATEEKVDDLEARLRLTEQRLEMVIDRLAAKTGEK